MQKFLKRKFLAFRELDFCRFSNFSHASSKNSEFAKYERGIFAQKYDVQGIFGHFLLYKKNLLSEKTKAEKWQKSMKCKEN